MEMEVGVAEENRKGKGNGIGTRNEEKLGTKMEEKSFYL